ncbi:MAG: hypothetical protein ACLQU4_16350 [Limisphaerales bacterium]
MMKDELGSPAFAAKVFGAVGTVMTCLLRQSLATAEAPNACEAKVESNRHQSGSRRVTASRSDSKKDSALIPSAYDWMFPLIPAFPEAGDNTMKHKNCVLGREKRQDPPLCQPNRGNNLKMPKTPKSVQSKV